MHAQHHRCIRRARISGSPVGPEAWWNLANTQPSQPYTQSGTVYELSFDPSQFYSSIRARVPNPVNSLLQAIPLTCSTVHRPNGLAANGFPN